MEQIEDKWREDYNELLTTVTRLQDDNRKLTESLQAAENDKIIDSKCIILRNFVLPCHIINWLFVFSPNFKSRCGYCCSSTSTPYCRSNA